MDSTNKNGGGKARKYKELPTNTTHNQILVFFIITTRCAFVCYSLLHDNKRICLSFGLVFGT